MSAGSSSVSVLLIGASRGLGLAIAEDYLRRGSRVFATVRGEPRTELHDLQPAADGRLEIGHLDITVTAEIDALDVLLGDRRFDVLLVNAGVTNAAEQTVADVPTEEFSRLMLTNALSPMRVVEKLQEHVEADGTIAVMSSGQGSVANNQRGGFEIYRASKAALNTLMRSYAARHSEGHRTLLLLAPGWVKTALGGPDAPLTVAESIPSLIDVIEAHTGHGGLQYLDYRGSTVAW